MRKVLIPAAIALCLALLAWSTQWHYETISSHDGSSAMMRTNRYTNTVQVFTRAQWRTIESKKKNCDPNVPKDLGLSASARSFLNACD